MYLPQPRQRPGIEENILPMINIVFLLLIFFMIAGALYKQDAFTVEPPTTRHAAEGEPAPLVIAAAADGRLSLDGEPVSRGALVDRVREWRTGNAGEIVRVKADGSLPADDLVELLERLRGAGVPEIRLLTLHERG